MPEPWEFVLMALATFRLVRLVGYDEITTPLRGRLGVTDAQYVAWHDALSEAEDKGVDAWAVGDPEVPPPPFSERAWYVARLVRCPWCLGAYLSAGSAVAYLAWAGASFWLAVPLALALSGIVGLIARWLDP